MHEMQGGKATCSAVVQTVILEQGRPSVTVLDGSLRLLRNSVNPWLFFWLNSEDEPVFIDFDLTR